MVGYGVFNEIIHEQGGRVSNCMQVFCGSLSYSELNVILLHWWCLHLEKRNGKKTIGAGMHMGFSHSNHRAVLMIIKYYLFLKTGWYAETFVSL